MKILLTHNYYRSEAPSGEDNVARAEEKLIRDKGVSVVTFNKFNDEFDSYSLRQKIYASKELIWSSKSYWQIKSLLKIEKPDIAHFHNIFYLISPSVYYACKDTGTPVVQTLHNFRFFCANGLLLRNGKICEDCIGRVPWRSIFFGCNRDSTLYSLPVSLMEIVHHWFKTWNKTVDVYIALSEFSKRKFIEAGLPEEKIFVKPNFLLNPPQPLFKNKGYIVFIGRLSQEKGVLTLIKGIKILQEKSKCFNLSLKIIGDGPQKKELMTKVRRYGIQKIEFLGKKRQEECVGLLRNSSFIVIPSLCYENFPMSIVEALACGKPIIASNIGSIPEIIEDGKTGFLFEPGDPFDLAKKIKWMFENEDACIEMGKNSRAEFERKYTAESNYALLMEIYRKAIKEKRNA